MRVKLLLGVITVIFSILITSCTPTSNLPSPVDTPITTSSPKISSPLSPSEVSLQSITITPAKPQPLSIGSVQDFKAIGTYSDGSTKDITSNVTWASSDETVASMYPYGGAFANSAGNTQVTATLNGITSPAVILKVPPPSSLISSVLIYLDPNYTTLWDSINQPDLSKLQWEPDPSESGSPYTWEQAILTVYLWNKANVAVEVSAGINVHAAQIGFSAHSDTVTIQPNGRAPLDITIKQSSIGSGGNVWFNVEPAD